MEREEECGREGLECLGILEGGRGREMGKR